VNDIVDKGAITANMTADKVVLSYGYGSSKHGEAEYNGLQAFKYSVIDEDFAKKGKVWKLKKGPFTHISQPLSSGADFSIRYGFCQGQHWAWIKFNPSKLTVFDWQEVGAFLDVMFANGGATLIAQARLKRLDIALDYDGVEFGDHLYIDSALRSGIGIFAPLGSTYLGYAGGARSLICYDKAGELAKKTGVVLVNSRLRVEARIANPKKNGVKDVQHLTNPFGTLAIVSKALLNSSESPRLKDFEQRVKKGEPADVAYWDRPKSDRIALWGEFPAVMAPWWNSVQQWEAYPSTWTWVEQLAAGSCN
jgi:hypothetical protein